MTPFGPGIFLVSSLLIAALTSALVIGLFRVSASSWLNLGNVKMSRKLSFSSRFTGLWELFVVISDVSFYFQGIGGDILLIIFYCIYSILLFSFLLV